MSPNTTNLPAPPLGNGSDIFLQGFHWETWRHGTWNILHRLAPEIARMGFTMVWFPPVSKSTGGTGYLPSEWYNLNSDHGSEQELREAVAALRQNGVRCMADIVVNHRVGTNNWADFSSPSFGDNKAAVTANDEWGVGSGSKDTGADFHAGRDLDHSNPAVQKAIIHWLNWLRDDVGFSAWRYDYVKGFLPKFITLYNQATEPYFSVGELWPDIQGDYHGGGQVVDDHRDGLLHWVEATQNLSAVFDFTTKWQLMLALRKGEYWRLRDSMGRACGCLGKNPKATVTFLDNHDTGPSPDGGQNHWPFPSEKVETGYAYLLTHPGTPCVYWPHLFDWGPELRKTIEALVALRGQQGIRANSSLRILVADRHRYVALCNDNTLLRIGQPGWQPEGAFQWKMAGQDWEIWVKA